MILGLLLGCERVYQGRAAGMRTYSLVCLSSCALTVFTGYFHFWFGGSLNLGPSDPTRVIQGIVTGVGFLGAGVIMKEGMSISGLTTSASIWLCAAIGVMVGIGFYFAAIALTLLAIFSMIMISKIEHNIPQKKILFISLKFVKDYCPEEHVMVEAALKRGYSISPNSLSVTTKDGQQEWHYIAHAIPRRKVDSLATMSNELMGYKNIESFTLTPIKN